MEARLATGIPPRQSWPSQDERSQGCERQKRNGQRPSRAPAEYVAGSAPDARRGASRGGNAHLQSSQFAASHIDRRGCDGTRRRRGRAGARQIYVSCETVRGFDLEPVVARLARRNARRHGTSRRNQEAERARPSSVERHVLRAARGIVGKAQGGVSRGGCRSARGFEGDLNRACAGGRDAVRRGAAGAVVRLGKVVRVRAAEGNTGDGKRAITG